MIGTAIMVIDILVIFVNGSKLFHLSNALSCDFTREILFKSGSFE